MFNRKKGIKKLFVYLSYKSISVAYREDKELISKELDFDIQTESDKLIEKWSSSLDSLVKELRFTPKLILLTNSSSFLLKNLKGIEGEEEQYRYVSSHTDISIGQFNLKQVKNSAYLVVENSAIEKILFAFKEYTIDSLHDLSVLNGLYLIKKKGELYLNISLNSMDIISNGKIFQKRSLKNIFLNYLNRSANGLNLDIDSTYRHFQKNFSDIKTYAELIHSTHNGAIDLKKFIDDIAHFIETTLSYFNNYDPLENIETIYLDGDILEFHFILDILKDKINFDGFVKVNDFLHLNDSQKNATTIASFSSEEELEASALILDGLRYSDGKHEYVFVDKSLVLKKKLTKEQKKKVISFQKMIEIEEKHREKNTSKKSNKSIWQMDESELFALIKSKIFPSHDQSNNGDIEVDEEKGKVIFLIAIAFSFGIYQIWFTVMEMENKFKAKVQDCQVNVKSIEKKEKKLLVRDKIFIVSGIKKILWTEKFITLSKKMPDAIWFSSIRLENIKKELEGKKITSSRVVLDGRCLPSSDGHVKTIANYMKNLMEANDNFKKDFINVSFGGAETSFDEFGRRLIRFKLFLNFRRNVNIELIKKEIDIKDKSIVDNLASIKENNSKKIDMLDNIGKE